MENIDIRRVLASFCMILLLTGCDSAAVAESDDTVSQADRTVLDTELKEASYLIGYQRAQALAQQGKTPEQGKAVLGCWAIIAEDPQAEAARLGEHILYQTNEYISWGAFGPPETTPLFEDAATAIENGLHELWDADTAVANLTQLIADYPMLSDIHFWAQFPGEPLESGSRRMQYIAENVLPRLRYSLAAGDASEPSAVQSRAGCDRPQQ